MADWRVELLGGLRAVSGEMVITHFESRKTAALLAYLALHPERVHPREELAALLWPDADETSGRNRLKQSLASLKKQLGAFFEAHRFGVRILPGALKADATEWEEHARAGRRREAASLWKGELLPGFYEDFLLDERERLNALRENLCPAAEPALRQVFLPAPKTRFIGRATEKAQLTELLKTGRWVTLTGAGGMGKTRLAQEVARDWNEGDVAFVPLASLERAEDTPLAILRALELPFPTQQSPLDALCSLLKDRPTLLVLDNAEHLEREVLSTILCLVLTRLPELRLLVTSRQALGGLGETRLALEPLSIDRDACTLFLDRARQAHAEFAATKDVTTLCSLLEGMPLAIELCAAWAAGLSARQMKERLERGEFARLLTTRTTGGERHHSSVAAIFHSSYARLTESLQTLLRGLSCFRGGWTLEAAEAVCPTSDTLSDLLALVEASLVAPGRSERFSMLESVRRFAGALLSELELEALQHRHYAWCQALVDNRQPEREYLYRCDAERDNLRLALEQDTDAGLLIKLLPYMGARGASTETADAIERALERKYLPVARRAELLSHLGAARLVQRSLEEAEPLINKAIALARAAGDTRVEALALYQLGRCASFQNRWQDAWDIHQQVLTMRRTLGDSEMLARSLAVLASLAVQQGRLAEALPLLSEAESCARPDGWEGVLGEILYDRAFLAIRSGDLGASLIIVSECQELARALGLRMLLARSTQSLGCTALELGDSRRARAELLEAARLFQNMRSKTGVSYPLWNLAGIYEKAEEWDIALLLMARSLQLCTELGQPLTPEEQKIVDTLRAGATKTLGAVLAEHFWQQGLASSTEEVLASADARPLR